MRKLLLTGLITALPIQVSALSLEQAMVKAIDHNPDILAQYSDYKSSLSDKDVSSSEYLPQISLRAAVGPEQTQYISDQRVDERYTTDEVNFTVSQLLFNGFKTSANTKRLSLEAEASRLQLISTAENVALQVAEVYLEMLKADEVRKLSKKHVEDHEEILKNVRKLAGNGFANETDIAQVAARLANARSSLIAAENNYADNFAKFVRVIGESPKDLTYPIPDKQLMPDTLAQAMEWAKKDHPQIQSAIQDMQAANEAVRASKSGYWPTFSVEASADRGHDLGGIEGLDEDYSIKLVMRYDLYNGGRDTSKTKSARWRYNQAYHVRRNAELQLLEGTRFAWNAYKSLLQQEALLRSSVDASSVAEAGYQRQYKLGKRTLLDTLNAKVEVFLARKNYISTKNDLTQAKYRLLNATGRLSYALRVTFPEEWRAED